MSPGAGVRRHSSHGWDEPIPSLRQCLVVQYVVTKEKKVFF